MNAYPSPFSGNHQTRIGDRERNEAAQLLGDHFAEGRLTREEYDERCDRAFGARTAAELLPLFADLPGPRPQALLPAPRFAGVPVPVQRRPRHRVPFLPVLLVLIGLAILFEAGWIIPLGIAAWILYRKTAGRRRHANGSRRDPGGSWA